jgi:hypothetical protein
MSRDPLTRPPSSRIRSAAVLSLAVLAACVLLARGASAQVWNEVGDAGDLPGTAQSTLGAGPLTTINGNLGSDSDVDMYCIQVTDPTLFSAGLGCVVIQGPHIWLFNSAGKGVAATSICQLGLQNIPTGFAVVPGTYYVAVSFDGVAPLSGANAIWLPAYVNARAPDGPGAAGAVTSWSGTPNVQPINPYQIVLQGATFCGDATPVHANSWGALKQHYR